LKDINVEVGARIKEKRLARKLTREDLARLSGYTANFIQEVERGRSGLSSESIRALSMALKVSADSLLFGDVPEEFAYISQQLKSVPPQKRKHIIRIIEEVIQCTKY
jgi:transcriptional regulator with XRE-family HTH domain